MSVEPELAIHLIHAPVRSGAQPVLDVVFMHGLGGHWKTTWQNGSLFWPDIVAKQHPDSRVWSVQYPALTGHVLGAVAKAQSDSEGLAFRVLSALGAKSIARGPDAPPCVLVCHSLGGIVAKRMLCQANAHRDDPASAGIDHTRVQGLMFLGTPHRGADLADWLQRADGVKSALLKWGVPAAAALMGAFAGAEEVLSAVAVRGPAASALIDELERGADGLATLNETFGLYFAERHRLNAQALHVRTCAERLPLNKLFCVVVDAASSDPNLKVAAGAPALPVLGIDHADHRTLCKPRHDDDEVCVHLNGLIGLVLGRTEAFAPDDLLSHRVYAGLRAHPDLLARMRLQQGLHDARSEDDFAVACTRRFVGHADFEASLDAIGLLRTLLADAKDARKVTADLLRGAARVAGWFSAHALVPPKGDRHPVRTSGHADAAVQGLPTSLNAALLESAAADHKGRSARFVHDEGAFRSASHILEADSVTAVDFRPHALRGQIEERFLSRVQGPGERPIHEVLRPDSAESATALDERALGRLKRRVASLLARGEQLIVDDRGHGALSNSEAVLETLSESLLAPILSVVGPCNADKPLSPSALGEIEEVLEQFHRLYAELDQMARNA